MKKALYIFLLGIAVITTPVLSQKKEKNKGQWLLSVGMGIDYGSTPSFTEYLRNEIPSISSDSIKTFSTGIEFFGGIEYTLTKTVSAKLDYSYYLRSNRYTFSYIIFDYTISAHQPYAMIYYRNADSKFRFKLGAGAGYHLYSLDDNSRSANYKAGGFSFRGEFVFAPMFSKKLETYLSGFVFGSTVSSLKDPNGNLLKGTGTGKEVDLGGYGVGARLGLSFYLN